jgi:cbb3-type cytochrome oxidase cytochrome c subunit
MKIAQLPEIRDIYVRNGFEFVASNTAEHARVIRDNYERWGAIIRKTGIKLD